MLEDRRLILGFKRGSRQALHEIYDKYKVQLLKVAVVLIGDVNAAEDIVHDVFVKFAQLGDRLSVTGSLKNYLVTGVINRTRNYRRDNQRRAETGLEGAETLLSRRRGPAQWAIVSERLTRLSQAMEQLPCEQREVVCLRTEMDMTFRQIAAIQKIPVNTAKGRYRYALEKLRSLLDSEVPQCDPQMT
jgi:RNA polymerase sigma-70 factor (ECF subfamily)